MAKEHVRNFAKLFTNLTEGQQRELERALSELDNQQEITNLNASLEFLRRKPNQNLAVPDITATPIVRGVILEWPALKDQRIAAYEIQVSTSPVFASFVTTSTFGQSAIIEGLSTTTFIRIRGIRSNGTQGPFSDTVTVNPFVFSIKARTQETFYFSLTDNIPFTVLGGPGTEFEYQPINEEGFTMAWANLSVYANPEIEVIGTDTFTLKLISRVVETNVETEHFRATPSGYWGTYQLGPVAIEHPDSQQTLEVKVVAQDDSPTGHFYPSIILYGHLNALELGTNTSENTTGGSTLDEEPPSGNP